MIRGILIYVLFAILVSIVAIGCAKPHVYIHPNPGFDRIEKIAVMPFDNFTNDDKAGEKVRTNFVIELLRTGSFNVMDIGETDRILQVSELSYGVSQSSIPVISATEAEEGIAASAPLSREIGDVLKVQAMIVGSVEAYSAERMGDQSIPEVSISARLIDAETGIIIWASTHTRRGGAGIPIFGWGKVSSLSMLSQQVIQDMVDSLAGYTR